GVGNINAYDPVTGAYLGQLRQPNGAPIAIKGLWDMDFGEGTPGSGRTNQLFFDAGPDRPGDFTGGLFGVIRPAGDPGGHGPGAPGSDALIIGSFGPGSGTLVSGVHVQPATSPSPAPAAGTSSPGAPGAGSPGAAGIPPVSTPTGPALGAAAHRLSDQLFAD